MSKEDVTCFIKFHVLMGDFNRKNAAIAGADTGFRKVCVCGGGGGEVTVQYPDPPPPL